MMRAYSLNYRATGAPALHAGAHVIYDTPLPRVPEAEALVIVKFSHDARLVREALDLAGIEHGLTVTTDGLEALSFVQKRENFAHMPRPDFIVLDLELDRISGRVVLDAIGIDPDLRSLPIILLGGSPRQWDLSPDHAPRFCRLVGKPIGRDALAAEFREIRDLIHR